MKRIRYLSLLLVFVLSCYLLGAALLIRFYRTSSGADRFRQAAAPTFTVTPIEAAVAMTPTPLVAPAMEKMPPTFPPTHTPSPTLTPTATPSPTATATPVPEPEVMASTAVNIRNGPGTNYPVVGALQVNDRALITGRNGDASWWQIQPDDGARGWVADWVVQAANTGGVPVAEAPPPPPTPTPLPPEPAQPQYQYEPTGWFDDTNYGLTRFLGTITDVNGNPVNGVYVEASCGAFRVLSNASGTTGWPDGFYDIVLARRPVPCDWGLAVVASEDGKTATGRLSELITITVTEDKSVVTANWRKNW